MNTLTLLSRIILALIASISIVNITRGRQKHEALTPYGTMNPMDHPENKRPLAYIEKHQTNITRGSSTNSEAVKEQKISNPTCVQHRADALSPALSNDGARPPWCLDVPAPTSNRTVFLASTVYARIWPKDDLAKLSFLDLAHWLTYYRYAGVERVYLYDTYQSEKEQTLNDPYIRAAVDSGFVHYVDWHGSEMAWAANSKTLHRKAVQGAAYKHMQKNFAAEARWMTFTDMDEYPFRRDDTEAGFLSRYLLHSELKEEESAGALPLDACRRQMTTQFMMPNVLCEGGRGDSTKGPMLLQQVTRMGKAPAKNDLVKQIVRMDAARSHDVHRSQVLFGKTTRWTIDQVMMKHLWGGRRYGWRRIDELSDGEREKLFRETVENDNDSIAERVLECF